MEFELVVVRQVPSLNLKTASQNHAGPTKPGLKCLKYFFLSGISSLHDFKIFSLKFKLQLTLHYSNYFL